MKPNLDWCLHPRIGFDAKKLRTNYHDDTVIQAELIREGVELQKENIGDFQLDWSDTFVLVKLIALWLGIEWPTKQQASELEMFD